MLAAADHRLQLTQQQRNNKRQRASSHQLRVLHQSFKTNPKPNSYVRQQIGRQIDMTPRSVQIWFQNKRAKLKKALTGYHVRRTQIPSIHILECTTLAVGEWVRVLSIDKPDLWVFVNVSSGFLAYTISHCELYYRVSIPLEAIDSVQLKTQDGTAFLDMSVKFPELITFEVSKDIKTWAGCQDFTGGQVSSVTQHKIFGPYDQLLVQAADLIFRTW